MQTSHKLNFIFRHHNSNAEISNSNPKIITRAAQFFQSFDFLKARCGFYLLNRLSNGFQNRSIFDFSQITLETFEELRFQA